MATAQRTALLVLSPVLPRDFCSIRFRTSRAQVQRGRPHCPRMGDLYVCRRAERPRREMEPLEGSTDLPDFVEHLRRAELKPGLQGTVRMETPVLYFYSSMQTTVSVSVSFARGLITEWYPHADRIKPDPTNFLLPDFALRSQLQVQHRMESVTISPGLAANFPHDEIETHYYAARETASSPLIVNTRYGNAAGKISLLSRSFSHAGSRGRAVCGVRWKTIVKNLGQDTIPRRSSSSDAETRWAIVSAARCKPKPRSILPS